jgi:SAM-dependent methyltransferase
MMGHDDLRWIERGRPLGEEPQLANRHYRPSVMAYGGGPHAEDRRLKYLVHYLDVRDRQVLELGPLYGHFTVMLDKLGAKSIIGVEARPENVEVCERLKATYGLSTVRFVQHDIERLSRGEEKPTLDLASDVIFNAGLLYHLTDPVAVLRWCREQAPEMLLMTQYYEPKAPRYYPAGNFQPATVQLATGVVPAMSYREGGMSDPLSGTAARSIWLTEECIVTALHEAGYPRVDTLGRDLVGSHPHISFIASS